MGGWAGWPRRLGVVVLAALGVAGPAQAGQDVHNFQHWAVTQPAAPGPVRAMMVSASITGTAFLIVRCRRRGVQFMADWLRRPPQTRFSHAWVRVDDRRARTLVFRRTSDPTVTFLEPFSADIQPPGNRARIRHRRTLRRLMQEGMRLQLWIRSPHGYKARARFSLLGFSAAYERMRAACRQEG
jgi:hypothetical protein